MKKYSLLFISIIVFAGCKEKNTVGPNGVTYKSALDYNNYIIYRQNDIMRDIMEYGKASRISIDEADRSLDKMIDDVSVKLKDIEGMPAYRGDSAFRDAAIALFRLYKTGFSVDFKEMHQLKRKLETGVASDEDRNKLMTFSNNLGAREQPLDEKLKEAQHKFAKDNDIKLQDNEVQKQLEKMKNGQ